MEEFNYLRVLFMSEGKMEWEIDGQIRRALAAMWTLKRPAVVKKRAEPEGKALNLQANLCPQSHLWSSASD